MLEFRKVLLSEDQYYKEEKKKSIIVLHHTAGGPNPHNIIHGWQYTPERVGTSYIISGRLDGTKSYKEGEIFQAFDDKYWAHHIGLKAANNTYLNQISIGIEIANWGQLLLRDGKYWNYLNKEVPATQVIKLDTPFKTYQYYHKYSELQIESTRKLLIELCAKYNIPNHYNENMFDVNERALVGGNGIYAHVSYRPDKFDISPQPLIMGMLKGLANKSL